MKYYKMIPAILLLATSMAFPLSGEDQILNQKDIIELVGKNNAAVKISSSRTDLARSIYNKVLKSGNPNISFTTDSFTNPLYGYSNSSFSSTTSSPVTESHTLSAGIKLSQLLPTGGTAALSIEDSLSLSRTDINDSWAVSQEPGLSINIIQPVFSNGRFIDFSSQENSRRNSQIGYEKSRMDNLVTKNNVLIAVLSSVHRTNILRQSRFIMEKGIKLANLRVEMAREDRKRGRISSSDLLAIELDVGRQQEALFDIKYQLVQAEMDIERFLGIDNASNYKFDLNLNTIKNSASIETNTNPDSNPDVLKAKLNVEQKEITLSLNKLADAPVLSFSLQTGPRYPNNRTDTSDPVSSLTDLFSKDAGINVSLGVAFNMDIWDGGVSKSSRESDLISLNISRQNLEESSRQANENRKVLLGKLKLLEDKIELLKSNIEYDKQLLQREIDLQERGSSTNVDVETVRLELLGKERDLQNIYGERYLTFLQVSALDGKSIEEVIKDF